MVDQVKVVADDQAPAEQSLRRNSQTDIFSLLPLAVPLVQGCFMGSGKTISLPGRRSFSFI